MDRVQITFLVVLTILLIIVLELVRRKKFREEYSLLWIITVVVMMILSIWRDSLKLVARALGIYYPPNALFIVGSMFILTILLHFSMVVSSLKTEHQELARRFAITDLRLEQLESKVSEVAESEQGKRGER